jgi:hypothetical protein
VEEADRLRAVDSSLVITDDAKVAWAAVDEARGRVLFEATVRLRVVELGRLVHYAVPGTPEWTAVHKAIDANFEEALEHLIELVAHEDLLIGTHSADILGMRAEPSVGRRLARLAREVQAICRPRIYGAIARGIVPLDGEARADLRLAIARELPAARAKAYEALRRDATVDELRRDLREGLAEIRACALGDLVDRAGAIEAHDLLQRGLDDPEPLVRRVAIRLVGESAKSQPRAVDWAIGRLTDKDRFVRVEALRIVRRVPLSPKQVPRLRLIVDGAPAGIKPGLLRLLALVERRTQLRRSDG